MHSYLEAWVRPGQAILKRIVSRKYIHKKIHFYLGKNGQSLLSCQPRVTVTSVLFTIVKYNINLYSPLELI